jgi:hypothetical protein
MRVALGLKAHSGWSALVVVGICGGEFHVIDRRRIELVEPEDSTWLKQPYHAAEGLDADQARKLIQRGVEAARRIAVREIREAMKRLLESKHELEACAVLVPAPMPDWSIGEILAVHFRMHKAEGVLFPDALARAAQTCGLRLVAVPEKSLSEYAEDVLGTPLNVLMDKLAILGKSVGAPWGKDQKSAALAAMIALQGCVK